MTLVTGKPASARASGDAQALDRLDLRVEGRTLVVRPLRAQSGFAGTRTGPLSIAVATPALDTALLIGSGTLDIDRLRARRVVLSVEGSGRVAARGIEADHVDLAVAGSGRIEAAGSARTAAAIARGVAGIAAADLRVADLTLIAETASPVELSASRSARVTASGSGPVEIRGTAACEVRQTGVGAVACGSDQRQLR